jgi:hypothetical protein
MPTYPGTIVRRGHADPAATQAIQRRLKAMGYGPFPRSGIFDEATESAVRLFQSQHVDQVGVPLKVDGKVGSFTWSALFPAPPKPAAVNTSSSIALQALAVASSQIGVLEQPPGSNSGPQVDKYLSSVGVKPGVGPVANRAWCAAFAYWCFNSAAQSLSVANPVSKTGGVLRHWELAKTNPAATLHSRSSAVSNPARIRPGFIFVYDFGKGLGHTGIVERVEAGRLITVEGNINDGSIPGREGVGVFRTNRRKITDQRLVGFIEY